MINETEIQQALQSVKWTDGRDVHFNIETRTISVFEKTDTNVANSEPIPLHVMGMPVIPHAFPKPVPRLSLFLDHKPADASLSDAHIDALLDKFGAPAPAAGVEFLFDRVCDSRVFMLLVVMFAIMIIGTQVVPNGMGKLV